MRRTRPSLQPLPSEITPPGRYFSRREVIAGLAAAGMVGAGAPGLAHAAALKQVPTCEYFPYEAVRTNIGGAENIARAPRSLAATTENFRRSEVARDWLGDGFVDHFAATRDWEWRQWLDAVTDWEMKRYFEII